MSTRTKRRFNPFLLLFSVILAWQIGSPALAQTQSQVDLSGRNVLILHALESNVPVVEFTDRGLRQALTAGGVPIRNQFYEFLDLARNPSPEHRKTMVELMRRRYTGRKVDLVISSYPDALRLLLTEGRTISPDVPILSLYMPERFELPETNRRIIHNSPRPDIPGTFEIGLKLFPDTKHIYVVGGSHEMDRARQAEARRYFKKWEGQMEFRYLTNIPLEEILAAVSSAPPRTIVMILSFNSDSTGRVVTTLGVAEKMGQISPAPSFGLYHTMLGHGIVGGSLISYERIGIRAGELALDILRGTKTPENIPEAFDVPSVPMFDWRQLKRWNLSVSALPKGSMVINGELTVWDYKYYIIGGIAILLAQTVLVIGLLLQRLRKKAAEMLLRESEDRFRQVAENVGDFIWEIDAKGLYRYTGPSVERILGYMPDELVGKKHFYDLFTPDVREEFKAAAFKVFAAKEAFRAFPNLNISKEGRVVHLETSGVPVLDADGNLTGYRGASIDITERKRAEEALRQSDERLRILIEESRMAIGIMRKGVITYVNKKYLEMFGHETGDEIYGKSYLTQWATESQQEIMERMQWRKQGQYVSPEFEGIGLRKDGSKLNVHVSVTTLELKDSPASVGFFTDVTERVRAEKALQEKERMLIQNQNELQELTGRLISAQDKERSRLARDLHDDLTQRLAVLAIDAGMLEKALRPLQLQASQGLADLKTKLIEVSDEVHTLSRQLHPAMLDDLGLVEAIQSECDAFSRRTEIAVSFEHGNSSVSIPNDIALCLYRVVQEGLQNISKHSKARKARIVLQNPPDGIRLLIRDSGIGFDPKQVAGKGAIGLSSINERVRLINGRVSIISEPGKGTGIQVFIPLKSQIESSQQ